MENLNRPLTILVNEILIDPGAPGPALVFDSVVGRMHFP
jgi:hypothetical protein